MRRLFSATVLTAAAVARAEHGLEVHSAALQAEDDGPGRLIVLSHGRGGSTVLGSALAELAHSDQNAMVKELFGENALQMRNVTNPTESMASWFDHQRARQPHARLVGFKWKPSVDSEAYSAAWDWVAAQGVSVVYMTRPGHCPLVSVSKLLWCDRSASRRSLLASEYSRVCGLSCSRLPFWRPIRRVVP